LRGFFFRENTIGLAPFWQMDAGDYDVLSDGTIGDGRSHI
jgi:hypothetical protein